MPGGRRIFEFVGKEPLALWIVASLLVANTVLLLLLALGAAHFLPVASIDLPKCDALVEHGVQYHAPKLICWYAGHCDAIQFTLVALMAIIFLIFHKRVRYIPRR